MPELPSRWSDYGALALLVVAAVLAALMLAFINGLFGKPFA